MQSYLLRTVKESRSHVLLWDRQPVHETEEGERVRVREEGIKASLVPSLSSSFLLTLRR